MNGLLPDVPAAVVVAHLIVGAVLITQSVVRRVRRHLLVKQLR